MNDISKAKILRVIKTGAGADFKSIFRLSRPVFLAFLHDLSLWLKECRSHNSRKNVPADMKIEIALYYMAHCGDGVNLGTISYLTSSTAMKHLHHTSHSLSNCDSFRSEMDWQRLDVATWLYGASPSPV